MSETILQANNLSKSYGDFLALDQFSCEIKEGVTGLLGPNGAGKTTFIRSLLGIHGIDSGNVRFYDWNLPKQIGAARDQIGYQPEVPTTLKRISAMKYVTHMCRLAGFTRSAANQRAFDVLHYVGLGEARYRNMETFSQGMLQKVKLATALVHDPKLLVLDEPTAGCDPQAREQILRLIEDLGKVGKNILISTHLLPDIERTASNVVVMSKGKRVIQGDLQQILSQSGDTVEYTIRVTGDHFKFSKILSENGFKILNVDQNRISTTFANGTDNGSLKVFELAKQQNEHIQMISPYKQSLEEVFIDVITEEEHLE